MPPKKNIRVTPSFCQTRIFSFQIKGIGAIIIKKSVITFSTELANMILRRSTQCPSVIVESHALATGWQPNK